MKMTALKNPLLTACTALVLAAAADVPAGKIYTWTDSRGVTHITETPPPAEGRLDSVMEYTPRSQQEIESIRRRMEETREERAREEVRQEVRIAERRARQARQAAEEARAEAEAARRRFEEFKQQVSNNIDRYNRNRSTVLRLEAEALRAERNALEAEEAARNAERQVETARERAQEMSVIAPQAEEPGETSGGADLPQLDTEP